MPNSRKSTRTKNATKRSYAQLGESDDEHATQSKPTSKRVKASHVHDGSDATIDFEEMGKGRKSTTRRKPIGGKGRKTNKAVPRSKTNADTDARYESATDPKKKNMPVQCGSLEKVAELPLDIMYEVRNSKVFSQNVSSSSDWISRSLLCSIQPTCSIYLEPRKILGGFS